MVLLCSQLWRGYRQRKETRVLREQELLFLGMAMEPGTWGPGPAAAIAQQHEASRRVKQAEHHQDFLDATVSITRKLREVEGPDMKETLKTQIRQWFFECR
ncbi:hypothetical protein CRUP_029439 [Coryphaenoides rupestris]|nr:hypothetical protein CRUP_029439 [Coryphaenoides rupestris]